MKMKRKEKKGEKERKMYKLVAIDLDGTMLNSEGVVTENTKKVIKEKLEKGAKIIIASGRPIDSIKAIAKEIGSENYFIAGNGALIYDIQKDEIIYNKFLPKEKVLEIIKICEKNSISYNVYTENAILATALKYNVLYYYKENLKKSEKNKINISIQENIYDYIKNTENEKFLKITICDDTKSIFNSIMRKVRKISEIQTLDVEHMSRKKIMQGTEQLNLDYYYTEISAKNTDKWNALQFLLKEIESNEKMQIKQDEIIAIGDNMNDKKMVENAGLRNCNARKYAIFNRSSQLCYR